MKWEYQPKTGFNYLKKNRIIIGHEFLALYHLDGMLKEAERARLIRTARQDWYYIPQDIAGKYCAQVREEMTRHWLNRQWWYCLGCALKTLNGQPCGLNTPKANLYKCKAIAMRYGHQVA